MIILLENLRDFYWENHLDKKLYLREIPLMGSKERMLMRNMRDNDC